MSDRLEIVKDFQDATVAAPTPVSPLAAFALGG